MIFDLHWWDGSAISQVDFSNWKKIAERENLILIWPDGMDDGGDENWSPGSWNVSSTFGPKGPICDLNRDNWLPYNVCYESCPLCDETYSCDWTTCADDLSFLSKVTEMVENQWCVDLENKHISGISNGGMLLWNIMSQIPDALGEFDRQTEKSGLTNSRGVHILNAHSRTNPKLQ